MNHTARSNRILTEAIHDIVASAVENPRRIPPQTYPCERCDGARHPHTFIWRRRVRFWHEKI